MTRSPQETLRAVVELVPDEDILLCDGCGMLHSDNDPSKSCPCGRFLQRVEWATHEDLAIRLRILARTLLAVMERCEESRGNTDGFGAMAEELIQVIHDGLKEME